MRVAKAVYLNPYCEKAHFKQEAHSQCCVSTRLQRLKWHALHAYISVFSENTFLGLLYNCIINPAPFDLQ